LWICFVEVEDWGVGYVCGGREVVLFVVLGEMEVYLRAYLYGKADDAWAF